MTTPQSLAFAGMLALVSCRCGSAPLSAPDAGDAGAGCCLLDCGPALMAYCCPVDGGACNDPPGHEGGPNTCEDAPAGGPLGKCCAAAPAQPGCP